MTQEERAEMLALMQEAMKPLQQEMAELKQGQTKLELVIENQIDRAIQVLSEGHSIVSRKQDEYAKLDERVEQLEHKVSAVEYVLKQAK